MIPTRHLVLYELLPLVSAGCELAETIKALLPFFQDLCSSEHNQIHAIRKRPRIVSIDHNHVRIWDVGTGDLLKSWEKDYSISACLSPDGKTIAFASAYPIWDPASITLYDTITGDVKHTLKGHIAGVNVLCLSPDSRFIASGSTDVTVRLWDVTHGSLLFTLPHLSSVRSLCYSPDGQTIASVGEVIKIWNTTDGSLIHTFKTHSWIDVLRYSPNGQTIISNNGEIWDVTTGVLLQILEGVRSVCYSPDGKSKTIVSSGRNTTINVWDATIRCKWYTLKNSDSVNMVNYSPDGRYIVSAGDESMKIWDVATRQVVRTIENSGRIHSVYFYDG